MRYDKDGYPIEEVIGEIVTPEQRIRELEAENDALRGGSHHDLIKLFENPSQLQKVFNLNEEQVVNVKALVSGAGSAAAVKYLSKHFGSELSAALGGFVSAYLSRKLFGGR